MPKKPTPTKKKKEEIGKKLNLKQDLFCQYYVKNSVLRGNGTLCYAQAYDIDLDSLSREDKKEVVWDEKKEMDVERVIPNSSEYQTTYDWCSVNASQLLRNTKVQERLVVLYNEMLREDVVDAELTKVILQDDKLEAKVSGIREFNKLKKRITDLVEVKRPLEDMSDEELMATIMETTKMLTKK